MKYRCNNAFFYGERLVAGGVEVDAEDPILRTHREHFVAVDGPAPEPPAARTEVATAAPDEMRTLSAPKRAPGRGRKAAPAEESDGTEPVVEPVTPADKES